MEEKENLRHIQLPNNMTEQKILAPQDLLVYLAIKRYMNNITKEAFPSLSTIANSCSASINTIRKSITNLKSAGVIDTYKKGRSQVYRFLKYTNFEPFSYEFLDKEDLTFMEKAYLVASQQYMFKENGEGKISMTNKELAEKINLSEPTISKCNKSLEKKDYLLTIKTRNRNSETGVMINEKFFHLNELQQAVVFALQRHEEILKENTLKIDKNSTDIESLTKEVELLKRALRDKNKEDDLDLKLD